MPHETKCQSNSGLLSNADADGEIDRLIAAGLIRELREPNYPGGPLITRYRWIGRKHDHRVTICGGNDPLERQSRGLRGDNFTARPRHATSLKPLR